MEVKRQLKINFILIEEGIVSIRGPVSTDRVWLRDLPTVFSVSPGATCFPLSMSL
jgi:hypothetical protein